MGQGYGRFQSRSLHLATEGVHLAAEGLQLLLGRFRFGLRGRLCRLLCRGGGRACSELILEPLNGAKAVVCLVCACAAG